MNDRSVALFLPLKWAGLLRIDEEMEKKGIDLIKHGESAYPAQAYEEEQYHNRGSFVFDMGQENRGYGTNGAQ